MLAVSMHVQGIDELTEKLARVSPRKNGGAWVRRSLITCAERVQAIAAGEMIIRGGRIGTGRKKTDAPADPKQLTSRTGRLRGSIRVNRSPLPGAIEIGSDVAYAAIHEHGGPMRHGGTMPARPYLAPALKKASEEFSRIFAKELGRELAR